MEEEIIEQVEEQEPLIIETKGKWQPFEVMAKTDLEVGKTYHLNFGGICEIAVSKEKPTAGIKTASIDYTKDETNRLWIKTGG